MQPLQDSGIFQDAVAEVASVVSMDLTQISCDMIAFLHEENRVLKAQLHGRRMRLSDDERRRLAVIGRRLRSPISWRITMANATTKDLATN